MRHLHDIADPTRRPVARSSWHPARGATSRWAATAAVLLAAACSGGEGRPDEELKGLVHAEEKAPAPIDPDRAVAEVPELSRALAQPYATLANGIGPHRFRSSSSLTVTENEATVEELRVDTTIQYDANGNYHALTENSKDYGREVFYVDGTLYLRPRYAPKFHKRAPSEDNEPARLLNELGGELSAYFEVVAAGAELVDRGHAEVSGRAGRSVEIKAAPEPARRPEEQAAQRQWRNDVGVRAVQGTVVLDAETAAPLKGNLTAEATFSREGRSFVMKLTVSQEVTDIGTTPAVEAPPDDKWVTTPEHQREAFEREQLLRGIAPPARKPPTPSTVETASDKGASKK